jgi:hypothetical protein
LLRPFIEKFDIDNPPSQIKVQYGTSSINSRIQSTTIYSGQSVDIKSSAVYV